jgi:hypothetical protein
MNIYLVGGMIIPHHICGSIIMQAACVKPEQLPSGTSATLGRAGLNATQLDTTRLGRTPPSVVPPPIFARDPPPETAVFSYECRDRADVWHSVCWDGTVDRRVGLRAFVLLQDGSASLVPFTRLRSANSKAPANDCAPAPRCILSTCDKPVEQGLCPKYCSRCAACSHAHYVEARETESFVHPGLIMPGRIETILAKQSTQTPCTL